MLIVAGLSAPLPMPPPPPLGAVTRVGSVVIVGGIEGGRNEIGTVSWGCGGIGA